jgi:hypothetical protein
MTPGNWWNTVTGGSKTRNQPRRVVGDFFMKRNTKKQPLFSGPADDAMMNSGVDYAKTTTEHCPMPCYLKRALPQTMHCLLVLSCEAGLSMVPCILPALETRSQTCYFPSFVASI